MVTAVQMSVSVLVVDRQPIYRAGVTQALAAADATIGVVGEAAQAHGVLPLVEALTPQVVLLTSEAGDRAELDTVRAIRRTGRTTSVVIMTNAEDDEQLFRAITCGAAAYLRKSIGIDELCAAIHRVASGAYPINEQVLANRVLAARVLSSFRTLTILADQQAAQVYLPLSRREMDVLEEVAKGDSNKEVAYTLRISDQTVKNHVTSIMRKLSVNDRTQAVVYAMHKGWITS
jgi:DNA-binding NarL/FixJ family response regulator